MVCMHIRSLCVTFYALPLLSKSYEVDHFTHSLTINLSHDIINLSMVSHDIIKPCGSCTDDCATFNHLSMIGSQHVLGDLHDRTHNFGCVF